MSKVNSAAARTRDDEEKATVHHDQVSDDQDHDDPSKDHPDISLSYEGQGFFQIGDLTALKQNVSSETGSDSDDASGSRSTKVSSNHTLPADIGDHLHGLTAEQKLRGIVDNSNTVEDICKRLTFSLPLAQLTNALEWKKNLVKLYPMIKGWEIQKEIPTFGEMLYIRGLKKCERHED